MLELPEIITIHKQLNDTIKGKKIVSTIANSSPHNLTFYSGDPSKYGNYLNGKKVINIKYYGFYVVIELENIELLFRDGVNLRFHKDKSTIPLKHQLLIEFADNTYLSANVAMYGAISCSMAKELDENIYLKASKEGILPISNEFNYEYFNKLLSICKDTISSKAFLATEQRIVGIGNGVAQDILFNAKIHPKRKIGTLSIEDRKVLFNSIKETLNKMVKDNGRDTEKDLFNNPGKYQTILSKNTVGKKCSLCGNIIKKESYLGGSIYYCPGCQTL